MCGRYVGAEEASIERHSNLIRGGGDPFGPFWEEKDKRGRWKRLTWRMNDEDARRHVERNGVELRKVEGSAEVRENYYGNGYGQIPPAPGKDTR